ncbi:MAG: hypothetical protein WC788_02565 [Candidatus Paceibacterota bacterium]
MNMKINVCELRNSPFITLRTYVFDVILSEAQQGAADRVPP